MRLYPDKVLLPLVVFQFHVVGISYESDKIITKYSELEKGESFSLQ